MNLMDRRSILWHARALPRCSPPRFWPSRRAQGNALSETAAPIGPEPGVRHTASAFGVIGLDHAHIYSMTDAMIRGGGVLTAFYAADSEAGRHLPQALRQRREARAQRGRRSSSDKSIRAGRRRPDPDLRAPLGIRAMQAGKDYLGDKPAITTPRPARRSAPRDRARPAASSRIMYSERLEVRAAVMAGELVRQGADRQGRSRRSTSRRTGSAPRPAPTGSGTRRAMAASSPTSAAIRPTSSSIIHRLDRRRMSSPPRPATSPMPINPQFEDFGDMTVTGDGGTGYIRVDWFTPDGLPTWGDGRLFLLGTEGYIELRKYIDIPGRPRRRPSLHRRQEGGALYGLHRRCASALRPAIHHRHRRAHLGRAGPGGRAARRRAGADSPRRTPPGRSRPERGGEMPCRMRSPGAGRSRLRPLIGCHRSIVPSSVFGRNAPSATASTSARSASGRISRVHDMKEVLQAR